MTDRADTGGDRDQGPASDGPTAPMEAVARRTPTGWRVGDEEVPDLTSAMVLADLLAAELSAEEQAELDAAAAAAPETAPQDAARHNAGLLSGMAQSAGRTSPGGSGAQDPPGARAGGPAPRAGAHRAEETPFSPADAAQLREAEQFLEAEQLKATVAQLERALTVRVRVEQAIGVLAERHRIRPRQAFELLRSASRARGQRIMETASQVIASATNPLLRLPEELAKPPIPRRMPRRSRGEA
jgi:ANTAR domain